MSEGRRLRFDASLPSSFDNLSALARDWETAGALGLWTTEVGNDPFLPLMLAAEHTSTVEIGTAIAVAFARNPMTVATSAWDLQRYANGRFNLGLGSQVKAHITRRYSMPWTEPAARMREFVLAIRAIWDSWQNETTLDFRGEFFSHTLSSPFFTPKPLDTEMPRILLAGVGPTMTRMAGEVGDGLLLHPFTNIAYVKSVTMPSLQQGFGDDKFKAEHFELALPLFLVATDAPNAKEHMQNAKAQIAFYGATPSYRGVLEAIGQGELQDKLNRLVKADKWDKLGDEITDDVAQQFVCVAPTALLPEFIAKRWGNIATRVSAYGVTDPTDSRVRVLRDL